MRNILNEIFPNEESLENFFEPLLKKETERRQKLELETGLNLLLFRVLASDRRFNRILCAFDVDVKSAKQIMADTIRHFKKQTKGGR